MELRPPDAGCRCLVGQDSSFPRLGNLGDLLHATPLGRHDEQRSLVYASEHASEAAAINADGLKHLASFADPHASFVGNVSVPDGVIGVDADTVGSAATEVGPHPAVRQAPAYLD